MRLIILGMSLTCSAQLSNNLDLLLLQLFAALFQLSMKNLSDIAKKMEDDAGVKSADSNVSTSASAAVRLHGGVNFISLDIDDAATLVSTLNAALPTPNSLSSPTLIFYVILLFIPRTP